MTSWVDMPRAFEILKNVAVSLKKIVRERMHWILSTLLNENKTKLIFNLFWKCRFSSWITLGVSAFSHCLKTSQSTRTSLEGNFVRAVVMLTLFKICLVFYSECLKCSHRCLICFPACVWTEYVWVSALVTGVVFV